ncbi:serine/threonine-protein kinase [Nonomuraea pusilla]|uniref:Serine/threonine protein kinase n=1 Tax=Nonomuraea pusilla TaxID=46177 RepID=A0A1H8FIE2_9ACTN|nr:serine/threonine-protein kinase [Nonomuraea pusilla]SEN31284.1 Serine/threonine protein kinase [Nonomuraea pusilla]
MAVHPLRPGDPRAIGPLRIEGRIGQGGQGVVYLGEFPDGVRAAVKVMSGGIDRSFAKELAAARKVDEFCTARVLLADLDHDPPYVASEYIDGPALSAAGPLRGAALTRLAIGTVTALAAIHRAGVVHRDFKPGNVLLGPDGPRVIDFGIARLADATATTGHPAGTPPYMAPEQLSGGAAGPASDVFAWGSTMVFACTGRPPFGADTFAAVAYRILHAEPDLGDLPEPLRSIVARCLDKDPSRRPSARDVLLELLGEPAAEAEALSKGARAAAGPAPVRRRALLLGAGAAAAAAAVTGGLLWRARPGEGPATGRGASTSTAGAPGTGGTSQGAAPSPSTNPPSGSGAPASEPPDSGAPGSPTASPDPSGTPASDPTSEPPAENPTDLAIAVETALAVKPLADLAFDGGLDQSSFNARAAGRVRYLPGATYSGASSDFAVRMNAAEIGAADITVLWRDGADRGTYLNGRKTAKLTKDWDLYVTMLVAMASVGVVLDLVTHTSRIDRAGRRYAGGLSAAAAPSSLREALLRISGLEDDRLKDTRLVWRLELDAHNRPSLAELTWRMPIENEQLSSTFTSHYRDWRDGTIAPPQ